MKIDKEGYRIYSLIIVLLVLSNLQYLKAQVYADSSFMELFDNTIQSGFVDGPHVQWVNDRKAKALYIIYDGDKKELKSESVTFRLKKGEGKYIRGYNYGKKDYYIASENKTEPGIIETDQNILVVGDVHGEYEKLTDLLKNAGIVNNDLDWIWEKGHLVLIGDLVDRGPDVTETLWFVKKIEQQAGVAGGAVHLLLGNHEIMDITGDHRYINGKYRMICEQLKIDYFEFFARYMELGRWLRTRNTIIRINDNLFVHGGISPELFDMKLGIDSINNLIHEYLRSEISAENFQVLLFLTDSKGPFWYRGMLEHEDNPVIPDDDLLSEVLEFYGASRMIVGHTENKYFRISENRQLFGIDVPIRYKGKTEQALLIDGEDIYKVFSDGTMVLVN